MDIELVLEEDKGKHLAHATVSPIASGKKKTTYTVIFTVDGKAKKPVPVDGSGLATIELGEFKKPGIYKVKARLVGQSPTVESDEKTIEVKPHEKKRLGCFGWTLILALWVGIYYAGPNTLVTFYLCLTMMTMFLIATIKIDVSIRYTTDGARAERILKEFWKLFTNNNWVFKSIAWSFIASALMAYWNPLLPGGGLASIFGMEKLVDPLAEEGFWGTINSFFFGESYTTGWRTAMIVYLIAIFPAIPVSFHDEFGEWWKELWGHAKKDHNGLGGAVKFLMKDGMAEIFWELIFIPLRALIGKK